MQAVMIRHRVAMRPMAAGAIASLERRRFACHRRAFAGPSVCRRRDARHGFSLVVKRRGPDGSSGIERATCTRPGAWTEHRAQGRAHASPAGSCSPFAQHAWRMRCRQRNDAEFLQLPLRFRRDRECRHAGWSSIRRTRASMDRAICPRGGIRQRVCEFSTPVGPSQRDRCGIVLCFLARSAVAAGRRSSASSSAGPARVMVPVAYRASWPAAGNRKRACCHRPARRVSLIDWSRIRRCRGCTPAARRDVGRRQVGGGHLWSSG